MSKYKTTHPSFFCFIHFRVTGGTGTYPSCHQLLFRFTLDCGRKPNEPTHAQGEHARFTQKGPSWDSNHEPSSSEATALTITPSCSPPQGWGADGLSSMETPCVCFIVQCIQMSAWVYHAVLIIKLFEVTWMHYSWKRSLWLCILATS